MLEQFIHLITLHDFIVCSLFYMYILCLTWNRGSGMYAKTNTLFQTKLSERAKMCVNRIQQVEKERERKKRRKRMNSFWLYGVYLLSFFAFRQTRCKRCLLFIPRHYNALQYRESKDYFQTCHSLLINGQINRVHYHLLFARLILDSHVVMLTSVQQLTYFDEMSYARLFFY